MSSDQIARVWYVTAPERWPSPPEPMSVSGLLEIEACPRRWALAQASYPVWEGHGYPEKISRGSMAGQVIHSSIEVITKALAKAGCSSGDDPAFASVMRGLGGFSKVVDDCIGRVVSRQKDNPRFARLQDLTDRFMREHISEFREQAKALLIRHLSTAKAPTRSSRMKRVSVGGGLGEGMHPEVRLSPEGMGWVGVADLIKLDGNGCEIVDFKTGEQKPAHVFQLQVYGLLWARDRKLNPRTVLPNKLTLAYPSGDVAVPVPSMDELEDISRELGKRARAVVVDLTASPPPARPSADNCRFCGVRQLCDEYWKEETQSLLAGEKRSGLMTPEDFVDMEVDVSGRHGPTTWDGVIVSAGRLPTDAKVIVNPTRSDREVQAILAMGGGVRIVGARLTSSDGEDSDLHLVSISQFSEVFSCRDNVVTASGS